MQIFELFIVEHLCDTELVLYEQIVVAHVEAAFHFKADKPNQKWTTDITEFAMFGKKIYLSPILDMYNGEIISYNINERPVLSQVRKLFG